MKDGPNIARIAALIGDPGRANMLSALMSGKALTARELAEEAGITPQTASAHLAQLAKGGLTSEARQGRHKYVSLANDDVATALEALMGIAARSGQLRTRPGPRDTALRHARVCYDHLAGDVAIDLSDRLVTAGFVTADAQMSLTEQGRHHLAEQGLTLGAGRRPECRGCLDWSARRMHLAGRLGAALLNHVFAAGWARRLPDSRVVEFTQEGKTAFSRWLA